MAKKILAIFFVSILLCSYVIPTTSAYADVVIGDNDSIVVTQQGLENGKKIATMEAMLQLLESGVSEINFNDISDLDDYLEEFYDELTNVNYQDVSNEILAGAYNDVKSLKQWIDDRGEYIATYYKDMLNSADQGLSDIFNRFNLKLEKTSLSRTSLNGVRGMSQFNGSGNNPTYPDDYAYLIELLNGESNGYGFFWGNYSDGYYEGGYNYYALCYPFNNYSWIRPNSSGQLLTFSGAYNTNYCCGTDSILTLNITTIDTNNYLGNISGISVSYPQCANSSDFSRFPSRQIKFYENGKFLSDNTVYGTINTSYSYSDTSIYNVLSHFAQRFRNINVYVDGNAWAIVSGANPPTLDIDGFLTMYGNDYPVEYEFPKGTQIDYDALYTTIYNAIRDNLPLDMQTINNNQVYYDYHDNVYSPTIYNYYGKDGDDENDWIDSILDYATIPDFNSVLGTVAVLDAPFVNGITIINAGVTDVIPTEILIILGAGFVLVLFVCIINRMSE